MDRTIAAGRERFRITTASLFILGFLFISPLAGLPASWWPWCPSTIRYTIPTSVVAHFHYVLIGGFVFRCLRRSITGCRSSAAGCSRNGWAGGFLADLHRFNVTFSDASDRSQRHAARVWTYPGDMGWDTLNLISTVGTYCCRRRTRVSGGFSPEVPPRQRTSREPLGGGHASNGCERRLLHPKHPSHHQSRTALGPAESPSGGTRRPSPILPTLRPAGGKRS